VDKVKKMEGSTSLRPFPPVLEGSAIKWCLVCVDWFVLVHNGMTVDSWTFLLH
jgi:hypothetical protein